MFRRGLSILRPLRIKLAPSSFHSLPAGMMAAKSVDLREVIARLETVDGPSPRERAERMAVWPRRRRAPWSPGTRRSATFA
jgi:hypothetical protein